MAALTLVADVAAGRLRVGPIEGEATNEIEAAGLRLETRADGALRALLERLVLRRLRLQAGAVTADVAQLALEGVELVLATSAGPAVDVLGLAAAEARLEGVRVSAPLDVAGAAPAQVWRLDALGATDGTLHAYITDAAWVVDADITVPVRQGRVDFARVVVAHIGPNSSMGLSERGLYVDAPNGRTLLFRFAGAPPPGVTPERRGALFGARVLGRGALELQPFAEHALARIGGGTVGEPAHHVAGALDRTRLRGELRLGDGALGTARGHLLLSGQADGRNRVGISAAVLTRLVVLQLPRLAARGAEFEWLGRQGRVGPISGALSLQATGLGVRPGSARAPRLALHVDQLSLQALRFGDTAGD